MKRFIFILGLTLLSLKVILWGLRIEFLDVRSNYLSTLGFYFSFPIMLLSIILSGKPKSLWGRLPIIVLAAVCSLMALIPLTCNLFMASSIFSTGVDPSYEKLHEIRIDKHFYTCFRSNGGATTDYGIDIRKESRFLFLVRYELLESLYHASDARFYEHDYKWFTEIIRTKGGDNVVIKLE